LKTLQTFPTNSNVCGVKSIDEVNRFFRAFFVMLKFMLTMLPTPYFKNTHISIFTRTRGLANNESTVLTNRKIRVSSVMSDFTSSLKKN